MTPTPQIRQRKFPLTDCSYQMTDAPTRVVGEKIRPARLRALWRLSTGYLGFEASLDYAIEAISFLTISIIAAWSIAVMMYQFVRWMI